MTALADQSCVPCKGGVPPLAHDRVATLLKEVPTWTAPEDHHLVRRVKTKDFAAALLTEVPAWSAPEDHHLVRRVKTKDFAAALALVNRIGALAEEQKHHPDLAFGWGWVEVKVWTHKIDGLTESDFVLAAKIDRLAS